MYTYCPAKLFKQLSVGLEVVICSDAEKEIPNSYSKNRCIIKRLPHYMRREASPLHSFLIKLGYPGIINCWVILNINSQSLHVEQTWWE
jgi:hypothetical protein